MTQVPGCGLSDLSYFDLIERNPPQLVLKFPRRQERGEVVREAEK